jgi:O-antigen/teichoic acid export membrane protein
LSSLISYLISLIYLALQLKRKWIKSEKSIPFAIDFKLLTSFFKYGAPMSLWFIFYYLLSYIDKLFMLKYCGPVFQGNYQAIFDLIFKSIGIIISPVTTSLFPILVLAYQNSNTNEIKKLLKKILFFELIALTITTFMYWLFGADLLLNILKINPSITYKWIGFIVLLTGFIWQFAVLIHKKYELKKQSKILLLIITIAFITQMIFYFLFQKNNSPLIFPLGFLLSAVMYLFLISFTELMTILKQKLNPNFGSL